MKPLRERAATCAGEGYFRRICRVTVVVWVSVPAVPVIESVKVPVFVVPVV